MVVLPNFFCSREDVTRRAIRLNYANHLFPVYQSVCFILAHQAEITALNYPDKDSS